jgi:hypothetical protein
MPLFDITYTVEAEDKNEALQIASLNIYLADVEVEDVSVRQRRSAKPAGMTFGEVPTESETDVARRIFEPFYEKGLGDV